MVAPRRRLLRLWRFHHYLYHAILAPFHSSPLMDPLPPIFIHPSHYMSSPSMSFSFLLGVQSYSASPLCYTHFPSLHPRLYQPPHRAPCSRLSHRLYTHAPRHHDLRLLSSSRPSRFRLRAFLTSCIVVPLSPTSPFFIWFTLFSFSFSCPYSLSVRLSIEHAKEPTDILSSSH